MADLIYIGIAALFFALTWGLVSLAGRLEQTKEGAGKP